MRRNTSFSAGSDVPAATLNAMQDEQSGLVAATENPSGALALVGVDGRYICTPDAGVADGQLCVLDDSVSWKARALWGTYARLESAAQRIHGASAYQRNDVTRPIALRSFSGNTGTGGLGAAAATVANGTPPVVASGAFAVLVDELATTADRVWLYARPSDGALCLYNDSGATLHAELFVDASAVAPTPGDPPPDVIPTLTDVLWITPGLAADRPADPGGPAIYRSTDTGAVEIWDGGTWRSLSGGGGTVNATQLQGVDIDSTAPTTKWQLLRYDPATAKWKLTSTPPWLDAFSAGASTTDATPTSCGAAISMADNSALTVEIIVHAEKTNHTAACSWRILATYTKLAGAVTLMGTYDVVGPTDAALGALGWSVAMEAAAVTLTVTGQAATNITWTAYWKTY